MTSDHADDHRTGPQRAANIEVNDLPDGVALYDSGRKIAHHLNPVAMLVWEQIDGRPTSDIVDGVAQALELDRAEAAAITESALEQFARLGVTT